VSKKIVKQIWFSFDFRYNPRTNEKLSTMYNIHLDRIEVIKVDLWYSNDRKFATDCGVSYPTYLAVRKTQTSWSKFLNGINALLVKNKQKPKKNSYFIKDFSE
jgi:hypothetical protein